MATIEICVCDLCKQPKTEFYIPSVGIGFGMCGDDYSFCEDCIKSLSADEFWKIVTESAGYSYPLVKK